jgi:pSer/pThr/pTyr-binding forkhead associated (FHA) protein
MTDGRRSLIRKTSQVATPFDAELSVGRSDTCGLRLTEGSPSRLHAKLTVEGEQAWIEDLGSTNGSFVNGARIAAKTLLKHGDSVRFDLEEYTYSAGAVDADKTMLRPPAPQPQPQSQPRPDPPPAAVAVAATPAHQLPPGWVEGGGQGAGANKTVFKSPQELAEERRLAAAAAAAAPPPAAAALMTDVPMLIITTGQSAGARTALRTEGGGRQEWSIGSDAAREICLGDSGVSALHARIIRDGERWKLVDQVSANGTYVNGTRATMSYLNSGDRLGFGPVECSFVLPASRSPADRSPDAPAVTSTPRGKLSPAVIAVIGAVSFAVTLLVIYLFIR